jgi:GNAT superfamily N-acetyltransferase
MRIQYIRATEQDAEELAALHNAAADALTARYGLGHWSGRITQSGVLFHLRHGYVLAARTKRGIVGTLTLQTRKPWAIDVSYFTKVPRPLYLTNMAVLPKRQGRGVGRACLEEAARVARDWPAESIRLDAYEHPAGAGGFYARCGYAERGRVVYKEVPLIYFERMIARNGGAS